MHELERGSEQALHEAIGIASRGRTTILIAQRMSTVRNADRIVVLDDAKITEEGRHEDLLEMGGWYAQIHESQQYEAA